LAIGSAAISIAVVIYLDAKAFCWMALALVPMGLGLAQLFGIMGWLGVPLNPANLIVLPLILGIGIDDGVHVVHDFRCQKGRYRISSSTATAVLITSLTTMMGFGSLMLAGHRGLQSLGRLLTIGVFCCLANSIVLLPAVLAWATRRRSSSEQDESPTPEPATRPRSDSLRRRIDEPHVPPSESTSAEERREKQVRRASVQPRRR
jgi:predicted RND superfamily exporter protein